MLTFRALQLDTGVDICLDLTKGLFEPAEARGKDWVAYGRAGQTAGNRMDHERTIILEGFVRGLGPTADDRRQAWATATQALMEVMDRSADPGVLSASDGYLGLGPGETWTINARCVSIAPGKIRSYGVSIVQLWSIELLSVDPNWDDGGS